MKTTSLKTLPHRELRSRSSGEAYSHSAVLSELLSLTQVFISHEQLLPGRRASSPHRHGRGEEIVYVIEGELEAVYGEERIPLSAGEVVAFHPTDAACHHVENVSGAPAAFLLIRPRVEGDDVISP